MASIEELLLKALDNLDSSKRRRFNWFLKQNESISAADVEKAEAPDTVDIMVARFGPEEAVVITLTILRKMNENHLANQLEKRTTEKDKPNLINPKKDKMCLNSEADKARFFDEHWSDLVQRVINVRIIADKLLQQQIIHEEKYSEITMSMTSQDGMRKICNIIRNHSVRVKSLFVSFLQESEPYLLEELCNLMV